MKSFIKSLLKIPFVSFIFVLFCKLFVKKNIVNDNFNSEDVLGNFYINVPGKTICDDKINFKNEYDLAVIIPCYNVEKYLPQCIDSLFVQHTNYKIQYIFVDDGSTDKTGAILDQFAASNKNSIVLHQNNEGISGARNNALKFVRSKYVTFVDSDDYIDNRFLFDHLLKFINNINTDNANNIIVGYNFSYKTHNYSAKFNLNKGKIINAQNLKGFSCGKVYSSSLFSYIRFPYGCWFEDSINNLLLFNLADKTYIYNECGYKYRKINGSVTSCAMKNNKVLDTFYVTKSILNEIENYDIKLNKISFSKALMRQIICNFGRLKKCGKELNEAVFIETCKIIPNYITLKTVGFKYYHLLKSIIEKDFSYYKLACNFIK